MNQKLWSLEFFERFFENAWEISKIRFLSRFLTLNNMVLKFSQNSNFSYFLGIKSEIHHYIQQELNEKLETALVLSENENLTLNL